LILAIIQARFSSTRLPGKVLLPLLGEPMLLRQAERVRRALLIDQLVVATSTDRSDDAVAEACASRSIACGRGSLDDVLDRFLHVAKGYPADYIVRLTGDCPLSDPAIIDSVIAFTVGGNYDYGSNTLQPTFPDGLDVEVFRTEALATASREAQLPSEREHVTPFLYKSGQFRIGNFTNDVDLSSHRWTVDEPADFELVASIFEALYPSKRDFGWHDVLALLERMPDLAKINAGFARNEGYAKSLRADVAYLRGRSNDRISR